MFVLSKNVRLIFGAAFFLGFVTHLVITEHVTFFSSPPEVLRKLQTVKTEHSPAKAQRFCDDVSIPCVFDIGHNTGQDTFGYLSNDLKPVRVVAVDANPMLMDHSRERFKNYTRTNRLKLITTGLVGDGGISSQKLVFWTNVKFNKFSSFKQELGCRDGYGEVQPINNVQYCQKSEIEVRTCASLIKEFGTPIYAKIDIEGLDNPCLLSILGLEDDVLPRYISIENVIKEVIVNFMKRGYTKFKAVDQLSEQGVSNELEGWSGPWGEDATDVSAGKNWVSGLEMIGRLPLNTVFVNEKGVTYTIWYDLHAKRSI